jgi:hypothetical protein
MVETIPTAENEDFEALESQIRECFGKVVYTTKTQEKSADETLNWFSKLQWTQIVLSALSTTGFIAVLFSGAQYSRIAALVAGVISVALVILNTYMQGKQLGQLSEKHKATAAALWDIRESYLSLLTDMKSKALTMEHAVARRDELQSRLAKIYESAPRASGSAYKEAQAGLQNREELTFSDEEIDKFLPSPLRKLPAKPASAEPAKAIEMKPDQTK